MRFTTVCLPDLGSQSLTPKLRWSCSPVPVTSRWRRITPPTLYPDARGPPTPEVYSPNLRTHWSCLRLEQTRQTHRCRGYAGPAAKAHAHRWCVPPRPREGSDPPTHTHTYPDALATVPQPGWAPHTRHVPFPNLLNPENRARQCGHWGASPTPTRQEGRHPSSPHD